MAKILRRSFIIGGVLIVGILAVFFIKSIPFISDKSISVPSPSYFPSPTLAIVDSTNGLDQDEYIQMAVGDLAQRLKVAADKIELVRVQSQSFADTSLGCPQQGKMYAQVITAGYIIELSYAGNVYPYHAGLQTVLLCGNR